MPVTDKRKRKENLITGLLIAGMFIVIGGTIIFAVKYTGEDKNAGVVQLSPGMTEASGFSVENATAGSDLPATDGSSGETTVLADESTSAPTAESSAETTAATPVPTQTPVPTPTPEPTNTPTPTPKPEPEKLTSLSGYSAGTVISKDKIDRDNLSQYFRSWEIEKGDNLYDRIIGKSYVENDDIDVSDLRYLKVLHVNFDGNYQVGELIVNKSVAGEVLEIFEILCAEGYQIHSMYLIDEFWAGDGESSDWYSIDANNTSAFCYRAATGSGKLSKHALGRAIDINPQQNPYVTYDSDGNPKYSHDNASDYVSGRSSDKAHVITTSDRAYELFTSYGWTWGGSWSSPKDYQHFQK